jgi:thiamine-monophosphate kinase
VQLKHVGEFGLIARIAGHCGAPSAAVLQGIGDDAAVVACAGGDPLLITTDALVEGVHFDFAYTSPYLLGKKSLSVNLSDIAAMGGEPRWYVVALAVPPAMSSATVQAVYRGMDAQARRYATALVGGDTVASTAGLMIAVTLGGVAPEGRVAYRSGARPGDDIYVSGTLGDAALGLAALQQQRTGVRGAAALVRRHLDPQPRIELGRLLAQRGLATGMIDVSDGLLADLRHVLQRSRAGASIRLSRVPLSPAYRKHWRALADSMHGPALGGGEDYELLFTAAPAQRRSLAALARALRLPLTRIGEVNDRADELCVLDDHNNPVRVEGEGFRHF